MTIAALLAGCSTAGDRVDVLCTLHNVSSSELARAVGCSPQNIGHLRANRVRSPRADLLGGIADYFGVSDRLLRTGQSRDEHPKVDPNGGAGDDARSDFERFMQAVTAGARTDREAQDLLRRSILLNLEHLERQRMARVRSPKVS